MKLFLLNTSSGLKPCYDDDFDKKKMLRIGEVYKAEIKLARNLNFHRKYFALFTCAWEYQNEETVRHFKTIECFRKTIEVAAGNCEPMYNIDLQQWVEIPKSISFEKMDEEEFRNLYERVKDVLFSTFLRNVSEEEFFNNLSSF